VFDSVLIANRGEIAVRIERTLARLGIESIAVFSDADAGAPHARAADRALWLGPTPPLQSYLDIDRVLDAAQRSGADAIHPGYGFLSERPDFAARCAEAGLAFVGPGPEAMRLLGDKAAAREVAAAAGVPTLPGWSGADLSDAEIVERTALDDFPLLVKAAAGGGGKGMRLVARREDLAEALGAARREAANAFGDDRLLVERYVEASRHIEVQVLADAHGAAVHLGERECSLQRRHQKILEEAPSPAVDAELRERMGAAAVALARAAGYVNAGTVELIAERDDPSRFFFLEVNTRLQVEHPVTEAVTGLDLVEQQLRVAAGEPLGFAQSDVRLDGWAVEARIYAEDPAAGFLPSSGRVVAYREPPGLRVDSGIEEETEVGTDYDPLLAKAIASGADRAEALGRLRRGLADLVVAGPTTNAPYLGALLARPEVIAGELDTGLVERLGDAVAAPAAPPVLAAVALLTLLGEPADRSTSLHLPVPTTGQSRLVGEGRDDDPWSDTHAWRAGGPAWIEAELDGSDGRVEVALRAASSGPAGATPVGSTAPGLWSWRVAEEGGTLAFDGTTLTADGESRPLSVQRDGAAVWVLGDPAGPIRFALASAGEAAGGAGEGSLDAPMPGTVIAVRTEPGAAVEAGETLVILESMKMEMSIQSPRDGTVESVLVAAGEQVERGSTLVALAAEESAA
jgi:acetyl-CoA/propionyl-CoA carboxylase biotin carboxyl carrier protein